ncbi:hypothetical protein M9H77_30934 [Catharanthus roseus]|uniref:Uncharacterized protein n=1 Tax=Catharanthus roseus TaxID=4058 RepID=A0ACC0A1A6_CATRO|nr:hypothetical protein M9H77_30934 [Catharanthus roseus]
MTIRVPSYYKVHRMFYFNLYSMNNDEEMRYLWTIQPHLAKEGIDILMVSSQSELDDDNDPEEGEFQTPQNPVNAVIQLGMEFVDKVQTVSAVPK